MSLYVYIAQSLDGYIADKNGGIDWLNDIPNPENSDFGFAEFMSKIDAIVMGRNTFEKVHSFGEWPYTKPVYVVSASLHDLPQNYSGKAEILNLKPSQIIEKLEKECMKNLSIQVKINADGKSKFKYEPFRLPGGKCSYRDYFLLPSSYFFNHPIVTHSTQLYVKYQ